MNMKMDTVKGKKFVVVAVAMRVVVVIPTQGMFDLSVVATIQETITLPHLDK